MHKRGLCHHAVSVCPSVCHVRIYILSKRINVPSKFFHRLVAKPFQFFRTKCHGTPTGTPPPYRGRRLQGGMKNDDFRQISRFISEMMQDRAIVTMEGE